MSKYEHLWKWIRDNGKVLISCLHEKSTLLRVKHGAGRRRESGLIV